jgi:hypothetical protein
MALDTPVGFVLFNRPDLTQQVFRTIAEMEPRILFLAADGPRHEGEADLCQRTRAIVERIDWPCEVYRDFSDVNLGCGRRLASSFDWIFSKVDRAIMLEDDTLPHPSFFRFCEALLDRYADDERVMHISGDNFQYGRRRTEYSYYFSKFTQTWGWATWRRAWRHFDFAMRGWPEFKASGIMETICRDPVERAYFSDFFDRLYAEPERHDGYSTRWLFACWAQGALSIAPSVNLVSNIGFGGTATHTRGDAEWARLPTQDIGPLRHPPFMGAHHAADAFMFNEVFYGRYLRQSPFRRELARRTPALLRRLYRRLVPRRD